jgi:hypothetical protein
MKTRSMASLIAVGSLIVLAGCGSETSAVPEPVAPSPTQAASPIPPVTNPRDVAAMARRPCELLSPQQAAGFGLDVPPKQQDGLLGTLDCEWTTTTRERQVYRTVGYNQDRGRPSFELTEIAGYPALVSRPLANEPICDIDVKPAERQSVSVTYESKEFKNNPEQACVVGKQVVAAVLTNLPPKS